MIEEQVKLPVRVAFAVVMQGIRIRFGRSLVTVGGVVLGIAFLASSLTGQAIRDAVRDEEQVRAEVRRMASFLAAEMGPPQGRVLGVVQAGPLNDTESRLLRSLAEAGAVGLRWHRASPDLTLPPLPRRAPEPVALRDVGRGAACVILMGADRLPAAAAGPAAEPPFAAGMVEPLLAFTRPRDSAPDIAGITVVDLARDPSPEEVAKAEKDRRDAGIRAAWIVGISLVVTVAGIANAMLMSVMERFREIGTMKCLGALSGFIRWVFLIESGLMGAVGGVAGALLGTLFPLVLYGFSYGFATVLASLDFLQLSAYLGLSVAAGVVLSVAAALYPAGVAASMVPAHALATHV